MDIDSRYLLSRDQVGSYQQNGFVKLRNVFAAEDIAPFTPSITKLVLKNGARSVPLEQRSTYDRAFRQVTNLWVASETVRRFVMDQRLGRIAAELMDVRGVRLYHDQALFKEPGGGKTPWHADRYYWPMATDRCCTAWIPLQNTPRDMGPLEFAVGSHRFTRCRGLGISDESEARIQKEIESAGFAVDASPYDLGDVSFHAGWTFHRAGSNGANAPRRVMTIIYMDRDMRLAEPDNANQIADRQTWCPGISIGDVIDSPLNPVIYEAVS